MRVIVVDDDKLICASLEIILGAQEDIDVVGTGTNGDDAVRLFFELQPDVALLDIQMPGRDGLSAAQEILARDPAARVVFLTTFSDDDYLVRALRYGARGYLIKQDVAVIAPALRAVMNGQSVLEGEVLARMAFPRAADAGDGARSAGGGSDGAGESAAGAHAAGGAGASSGAADTSADGADVQPDVSDAVPKPPRLVAFDALTDREYEVVRLVAEGLDNREIAAAACMSEGTVRNYVSTILAKLHLKNRTQIAVVYYRAGVQTTTRPA